MNPSLQRHKKDPGVLRQMPLGLGSHGLFSLHSSTSEEGEEEKERFKMRS